ncbi:DNA mismatch repair endonuclease MutL [Gorillibacterium sp. sgz5001074]|uniref:DNA mismatch repair endonuclease MutL n=1 Tax=Gorillibacterium sp. sgz5001074 TaxID=3446695 RepID=UPI003F67E4EF
MGVIRVLDDHIANQIAAGEVVERPSSVVKELVENAIDAGSTRIDVTVEEGGLNLIRISDNGSGIAPDDLERAFQRHATSKIATGKDLFQIRTLGFRGEALPSIAAVAKVECVSAQDNSGLGRRLAIEGGSVKALEDTAAPKGTDIRVKELFFNTPARLKYMKTIQTELGHVSDYMYRLALSHPGIAFTLKHNGTTLVQTLGNGDLLQVVAGIYGTGLAKMMLPVSGETLDYKITGYISKPEQTRSNRAGISTVINGRYIRNFVLAQALLKAYHTLLPLNRYPVAVLHIEMDPTLLDVNVHPSKLEVRFSKEAELVELLERTAKAALTRGTLIPQGGRPTAAKPAVVQEQLELYRPGQAPGQGTWEMPPRPPESGASSPSLPPSPAAVEPMALAEAPGAEGGTPIPARSSEPETLDSSATVTEQGTFPARPEQREPQPERETAPFTRPVDRPSMDAAYANRSSSTPAPASYRDRPAGGTNGRSYEPQSQQQTVPPGAVKKMLDALEPDPSASAPRLPRFPQLDPIGQLHGTYIVAQNGEGLYLIDQHAAHERINYEYYYELFGKPHEASQELLVPLTLELTPAEAELLKTRLSYLEQVGVYMESFGGNTFLVRAYPHWLPKGEEKEIIDEMTEWVLAEKKAIDLSKLREKSSTLCSCKASIKANQGLTKVEMEALLDRLAACRIPYTCPHGRPIVVSFSTYELEKMFKRVM